eukprot:scaffold2316_cov20-Tisochrysis_lutea.AAC.1
MTAQSCTNPWRHIQGPQWLQEAVKKAAQSTYWTNISSVEPGTLALLRGEASQTLIINTNPPEPNKQSRATTAVILWL